MRLPEKSQRKTLQAMVAAVGWGSSGKSGEIQPVKGQVGNTVLLPGDASLICVSGRSPGGGHGNPL